MRLIDADRALEIVRDQGIAHPNAYHLTNYATLILREAPTITDLRKCMAFNSAEDDKPQTNAQKIRAMSDEELAEFLTHINPTNCQDCAFSHGWRCQPDRGNYSDFEKCVEGRKRWLQQPAEEVLN